MLKISPHVTIYKFPITAVTSILNRVTGMVLTGGFISGGMVCLANKEEDIQKYKNVIETPIVFSGVYHTLGGMRHMFWDKFPQYLTNSAVTKSSYGLIGSSVILTYIFKSNVWYTYK